MTNTETTAKMLERVRALLAKAESTTFPDEADAFRAKADELMTRFAIDQYMVEQAQRGVGSVQMPERRDFSPVWINSKFRADLYNMFWDVAEHCRCVIGSRGYTYKVMPVYGLPSDLDYLDMLFTTLQLELAKNLQPPVSPAGEVGHEVFKQRQAGIGWEQITRKVYEAGLVKLTKGEVAKVERISSHDDEWTWTTLHRTGVWMDVKNRLANANRRYVREHGLEMDRNYVKPEVYQRSFAAGFRDEIGRRLRAMRITTRKAYDASGQGESMALAVRDVRQQAMALYEEQYPPPAPPTEEELAAMRKRKGRAVAIREVAYDYDAMSAGRAKARETNLTHSPARRVGGDRKRIDG